MTSEQMEQLVEDLSDLELSAKRVETEVHLLEEQIRGMRYDLERTMGWRE